MPGVLFDTIPDSVPPQLFSRVSLHKVRVLPLWECARSFQQFHLNPTSKEIGISVRSHNVRLKPNQAFEFWEPERTPSSYVDERYVSYEPFHRHGAVTDRKQYGRGRD